STMTASGCIVHRYTAGEDDEHLDDLIAGSLRSDQDTARWIAGERGWRFNSLMRQFRKQGGTTHSQSGDSADWQASDRLQTRRRRLFGWSRWSNVGRTADASASEFDDEYAGVPTYYNVRGRPAFRGLQIAAIATRRQGSVAHRRFRELGRSG